MFKLLLAYLLVSFSITCSAQDGGYMGRNHLVGVQTNFHPGGLVVPQNENSPQETHSSFIIPLISTNRINYEFILKKGFSLNADIGFKNIVIGSINEELEEEISESNLFSDPIISQGNYSKYYISGFDLVITSRFYPYKTKGKIAPFGRYFGLSLGLPNYKTYYRNDIVEKSQYCSFGISMGKQGLLFDYLTYDLGIRTAYTAPFYQELKNEEIAVDVSYTRIPSSMFVSSSKLIEFYFKVAYLL